MIEEEENPRRKLISITLALLILALLCWGAYTFINSLSTQAPPKKQKIQQIELLAPPPPPPPPPPEIQEPEPEPEPEPEEPIPEPEPEPEAAADENSDEPPPGEDLGLDAEGGVGSDAFGLLGKKGGRSLIGGGRGGSRFAWFAAALKQDMTQLLSNNDKVRQGEYDLIVKVWISADGRLERCELVGSSGQPDLDQALQQTLAGRPKLSERPPDDMPQPVRLRIKSRI